MGANGRNESAYCVTLIINRLYQLGYGLLELQDANISFVIVCTNAFNAL